MKKLIFAIIVLFSFSTVQAQIVQFGLKGGYNSATLSEQDGNKALSGFHVGALAEIDIVFMSIQSELVYSTQGSAFDSGDDTKLDYLNVPVMAKLNLLKILYLEAGPQFGFLLSAKDGSKDIKDNLNSTDIAVGVGAGVELFDKFDIGLRYNFGVTDVNKDGDSVKNNVLQFGLSYKF
jgi:hypothetical protein